MWVQNEVYTQNGNRKQLIFERSDGFALVNLPLFQGMRLGWVRPKLRWSCMIALLAGFRCSASPGPQFLWTTSPGMELTFPPGPSVVP